MKLKQIIILLFSLALASPAIAQGYQKDSLQIKVYTEIEYEQYRVKSIKATRVFCDYCSENQTKKIKEEALRLAYLARNKQKTLIVGKKTMRGYPPWQPSITQVIDK